MPYTRRHHRHASLPDLSSCVWFFVTVTLVLLSLWLLVCGGLHALKNTKIFSRLATRSHLRASYLFSGSQVGLDGSPARQACPDRGDTRKPAARSPPIAAAPRPPRPDSQSETAKRNIRATLRIARGPAAISSAGVLLKKYFGRPAEKGYSSSSSMCCAARVVVFVLRPR